MDSLGAVRSRIAVLVLTGIGVAIGVVVVWPQGLGLAEIVGPAQAVAMRGTVGVVAAVLAVVLVLVALVVRRGRRFVAIVAALAAVIAVVQAGVLYSRGLRTDPPEVHAAEAAEAVRVLAFNLLYDHVPGSDVVDLVERYDADIVVLSEASAETVTDVAEAAGGEFQVFTEDGNGLAASTGLLVHERLGTYGPPESQPGGLLSSFTVRPLTGSGPPITAVHALPPGSGQMREWRDDGAWAVQQCEQFEGAIVAGDFNATLDHAPLRDLDRCVDAAAERDAAGVATWPSHWKTWLGAPIDHVLADGERWDVHAFTVVDLGRDSDHRPVVATLVPH